jgi:hypothetical protein
MTVPIRTTVAMAIGALLAFVVALLAGVNDGFYGIGLLGAFLGVAVEEAAYRIWRRGDAR